MSLDPKRTVAELKELRTLTGDENGAQRVAFTRRGQRLVPGCAVSWKKSRRKFIPTKRETFGQL